MGLGMELGTGMELGMGMELGVGMDLGMGIPIGGCIAWDAGPGLMTGTINARPAHRRPVPVASATTESSAPNGAIANYGDGAGRRHSRLNRR